ncbi:hypothetical protein [Bacillus sp. REN16]|uniref:hypothetical protein n=1 Tax=Bacillus sp. REN16 TaxID=2887296 RepID=UPI001E452F0B|nr:hypothetical protein [Bacillus sp. REN16]MCC3359493.1 hypothetical protein [Bacillus sp. REN16]
MAKTNYVDSSDLEKFEQKMLNKLELSVESLQERFDTLEENSVDLKEVINQIANRQTRLENTLLELIHHNNEYVGKGSIMLNDRITSFQEDTGITFKNQSQDLLG